MKSKPDDRHKSTQDVKNNQQRTYLNQQADQQTLQQTGDDVIRAELNAAMEHRAQALDSLRQKLQDDSSHQQNQLQ